MYCTTMVPIPVGVRVSLVRVAVPLNIVHVPPTGLPIRVLLVPSQISALLLVILAVGLGCTVKLVISLPPVHVPDTGALYCISIVVGVLTASGV